MKKLMILIIAVIAIAACTKENLNETSIQNDSYTLNVIAPGHETTKTSLSHGTGSNWNVLWSDNDELRVRVSGDGTSSSHYADYTLESGAGTGNAVFRGTVEAPDEVFAFYPSSLTYSINSYGLMFTTPINQTYAEGGVANNSLPIFANGPKGSLAFNHTCSILSFPIWIDQAGVKIDKLLIESLQGISGVRLFRKSDNFSKPSSTDAMESYVKVDCGSLVVSQDSNNPTIVNAIIGTNVSPKALGELTITVYFSDGTSITRTKSSSEVEWGKIYKVPVWKLTKSDSDLKIKIDEGDWDDWDGGEISTPILTKVAVKGTNSKLTGTLLKNILSSVESSSSWAVDVDFSQINASYEIQTIRKSEKLFFKKRHLKDLILPEGIQKLEDEVFEECQIDTLTIPSSTTSIGTTISRNWTRSTSGFAVSPSNPKYIAIEGQLYEKNGTTPETYTLKEVSCGKTGAFTIVDNTTIIGNSAMKWSSLSSVVIPASVMTIQRNAFYIASKLGKITLLGETPPTFEATPWYKSEYCAGYNLPSGTKKTVNIPVGSQTAYESSDWNTYFINQAGFEFATE